MRHAANIRSIEALQYFRSNLIVYAERVGATVDEVMDESRRTRMWLQTDRKPYWQKQVRLLTRKLDEAKSELFSARLSRLHEATQLQAMAVDKAQRALNAADAKLKLVNLWTKRFDQQVDPVVKQVEKLRTLVLTDVPKATAYLSQAVRTLDEYAETHAPSISRSPLTNSSDGKAES